MRGLTAGLGVALLLAGGALGAWSDGERATPRPRPGPAALLGGFSALAVQVLTIRADAAAERGDTAEALVQLDLVLELEPQLVRGADWIAHVIGVNMAALEPDPDAAFALSLEGLRAHDRCVDANPGNAKALTYRGEYVMLRFATARDRAERFAAAFRTTPYLVAIRDFRAALALAPDDVAALDGLGVAAMYAARDELLAAAALDDPGGRCRAYLAEAHSAFEATLARYREAGVELETKEWADALVTTLTEVLDAPPEARGAAYAAFWERFGGPSGLPGLPAPEDLRGAR